jgi:superfamily II DNA helicase RecQ
MAYAFFHLSTDATADGAAALNTFLRTQRIVKVTRQWCEAGRDSGWAFCIEYLEGGVAGAANENATAKVDYKTVLPPEQFEIFARLRALRKSLAEKEGQPVFAIFTNAQLAEISQKGCKTLSDLKEISGIGEARVAKCGSEVLAELMKGGSAA